jgi:predicted nucleotidyltransferase
MTGIIAAMVGREHSPSDYGRWVRARRLLIGMSQRELAAASGVPQPTIASLETGKRTVGAVTRRKLDGALVTTPSNAVAVKTGDVVEAFARYGQPRPQVFGSVARGDDTPESDVDFLVHLNRPFGLVSLLGLVAELEEILTFPVDVVDDRDPDDSPALERARAEAVPL